ncbi:MAG: helix-turn-helix transcriptional regulator [Bryobacteraceae bacterium]|nr:helix-turn-helix transcriptional regulator [Bryobacteraceae bacterium]
MLTLLNYLRMYRKRSGLTQDEVGYLLGCANGSKVSRYEQRKRTPTLETALAYEAIFRVPVRDLFAGVFAAIERKTLKRIGRLGGKLSARVETPIIRAKLETLATAIRASRQSQKER